MQVASMLPAVHSLHSERDRLIEQESEIPMSVDIALGLAQAIR